jgi:pyruvate carboxylase subunit B
MNVIQLEKGGERWSMIADNIWDMILGKSGVLPGELSPEIIRLAHEQCKEFYTGNPQDLYPDNLDDFRGEMKEKGWDLGQDDEELFELAMHPEQYRAYKSGKAKADFEADLETKREAAKNKCKEAVEKATSQVSVNFEPKTLNIDVNGEKYLVKISYGESTITATQSAPVSNSTPAPAINNSGQAEEILAPLEGKFFFTRDSSETAIKIGDVIKEGELIGYIESMKTYNAISADKAGKIVEICFDNGDSVEEDDVLIKLQK